MLTDVVVVVVVVPPVMVVRQLMVPVSEAARHQDVVVNIEICLSRFNLEIHQLPVCHQSHPNITVMYHHLGSKWLSLLGAIIRTEFIVSNNNNISVPGYLSALLTHVTCSKNLDYFLGSVSSGM